MYQNKFVAVIKSEGKILREKGDIVTLPFGSEYTLLLKNLNSKKAQINITIDGSDILDGKKLLLDPNSDMELEGFLKGQKAYKKFKFIDKTPQISEYRGDKIDDGIIRIEFTYEKDLPYFEWSEPVTIHREFNYGRRKDDFHDPYTVVMYGISTMDNSSGSYTYDDKTGSVSGLMESASTGRATTDDCFYNSSNLTTSQPMGYEGITVGGSECDQNFEYGSIGQLEENSSVIVLRLRGFMNDKKVEKSITVKSKLTCPTCGAVSKSTADFCYKCGTSLN